MPDWRDTLVAIYARDTLTQRCMEGENRGKHGPCPEGGTATASPAPRPRLPRKPGLLARAGAPGRAVRLAKVVEHRVLAKVNSVFPPRLRHAASLAVKGVFSTWIPAQMAAHAVAREVGGERYANRVSRLLITADLLAAKIVPAAVGSVAGPAAATTVYMTPLASVAYLAYSTARHPIATLRAARKAMAAVAHAAGHLAASAGVIHKSGTLDGYSYDSAKWDRQGIADLLRGFDAAGDERADWYEALVVAGLEKTGGDAFEAVRLANRALAEHPEEDWRGVHNRIMDRFTERACFEGGLTQKDGFTGEKKDKRGHRICYQEGRRTPCPKKPKEKGPLDKAGGGEKPGVLDRAAKPGAEAKPADGKPAEGGEGGKSPAEKPAKAPKQPRPAKQAAAPKPTVDQLTDALTKAREQGLTPDMLQDAATLLGRMTVKEITEVKQRLGLKASGNKAELVQKIIERAGGGKAPAPAETTPTPAPVPAAKPKAPAKEENASPATVFASMQKDAPSPEIASIVRDANKPGQSMAQRLSQLQYIDTQVFDPLERQGGMMEKYGIPNNEYLRKLPKLWDKFQSSKKTPRDAQEFQRGLQMNKEKMLGMAVPGLRKAAAAGVKVAGVDLQKAADFYEKNGAALFDSLARSVGASPAAKPTPKPTPAATPKAETATWAKAEPSHVLGTIQRLSAQQRGGPVLARDLTRATGITDQRQMGKVLSKLIDEDKVVVHRHDQPSFLTDKEKKELPILPNGHYVTAIDFRS